MSSKFPVVRHNNQYQHVTLPWQNDLLSCLSTPMYIIAGGETTVGSHDLIATLLQQNNCYHCSQSKSPSLLSLLFITSYKTRKSISSNHIIPLHYPTRACKEASQYAQLQCKYTKSHNLHKILATSYTPQTTSIQTYSERVDYL